MKSVSILALGLALSLIGCSESPSRAATENVVPASPSMYPPPPSPVQALAGHYQLALTLPAHCTQIPDGEKRRTYDAAFESNADRGYLGLRVTGVGYPTQTLVGGVWGSPQAVTFKWNWFDIGPCDDGYPERLPGTGSMMLCGSGNGAADEAGNISTTFNGEVRFYAAGGGPPSTCGLQGQPFTFTKVR